VADGIYICHEVIAILELADELFLHVSLWLTDADSVVLSQPLQEGNPLAEHPLPIISFGRIELGFAVRAPLFEQRGARVFALEERLQGFLKTSPEQE
jgi:hypothetical protein